MFVEHTLNLLTECLRACHAGISDTVGYSVNVRYHIKVLMILFENMHECGPIIN